MMGNPELNAVFDGFLQWVSVIGIIMIIVMAVALPVSLASAGLSGPKSVLRYLFHNKVTRNGGIAGGILGSLLGGLVGWFNVYQISRYFGSDLSQFSETTAAVIGLVVCGLLGLAIGPVTLAMVCDALHSSPRRVWALTTLTIKESGLKLFLGVFAVFIVVFMFAAWFIPDDDFRADLQVKNYISTALIPITWIPLLVMMLLACWGLPDDIKKRTIHTVVTKPVRRNEILLGRILGLICVGTLLLVVMGVVGFTWIMRQVPDEAKGRLICRIPVKGDIHFLDRQGNPTSDGINVGDEDQSRKYIEGGTGCVAIWNFHNLSRERLGDSFLLETRFRAFRLHKGDMDRPLMGQIRLVKRLRKQAAESVGAAEKFQEVKEHLQSGAYSEAAVSLAAVADGLKNRQITPSTEDLVMIQLGYYHFANLLEPFQQERPQSTWIGKLISLARDVSDAAMTRRSGRSASIADPLKQVAKLLGENAGELEKLLIDVVAIPIRGSRFEEDSIFYVHEFGENEIRVDRKISYRVDDNQQPIDGDLFKDIVHGGELQIEVICLDPGQFLGMARQDLFIRARDNPFVVGYAKAVFGIWLMLVLVIMLGVTASCFLKGPVGIMLAMTLFVVGSSFHPFLEKIVQGELEGGGAIEAARRLVEHLNPKVELEDSQATQVIRSADKALTGNLWLVHKIVPNFNTYRMSEWISEGFDVPLFGKIEKRGALIPGILMTLAYLLPCLLIGSYSLKLRELESK